MRSVDRVRGTLALASIAVLGSALAGCGGDDTTTVTSTVTAPSGVTDARDYSGTTSQGLPISFAVSPTAVSAVRFGWRARCEDGQVHQNTILLGGGSIEHGSFVVDGTLTTGGVAHVEGTLKGDRAFGHLSRSKGTAFGTNCLATGIAWHARAGSG